MAKKSYRKRIQTMSLEETFAFFAEVEAIEAEVDTRLEEIAGIVGDNPTDEEFDLITSKLSHAEKITALTELRFPVRELNRLYNL